MAVVACALKLQKIPIGLFILRRINVFLILGRYWPSAAQRWPKARPNKTSLGEVL